LLFPSFYFTLFYKVLFQNGSMTIFDLLFIAIFLATVVTLLGIAFFAIRGRGARALALLRAFCICAGVYLAMVVLASVFWPRTVLQVGDPRCFDDWCIAVENVTRQPSDRGNSYIVALRLSSTARRVFQREYNVVVYLTDNRGRRYDPTPQESAVSFNVQLGPLESVTATRAFNIPADAEELGLVITHEGGFPGGWFIIGEEAWFRKPTIVRLP
jgi:hypothetical protein